MSGVSVLALVPYALGTTPSQRFRLEQWAPHLEREGIALRFSPYFDERGTAALQRRGGTFLKAAAVVRGFKRRMLDLGRAAPHDRIVIHRAAFFAGPASLDLSFYHKGRPVIYDFDDAIYLRHASGANPFFDRLKFPSKTKRLCGRSALVTAGSQYLTAWARQHARTVHTVPTSIDVERYKRDAPPAEGKKVVVGWTGSSTSLTHLERSAPLLRELAARRDVQIRVVANRPPSLPGLPVEWRAWTPATEVDEIAAFDIGIKPMPDDPWSRGKCPMKELQYMALEVPVVCAAVGGSREAVKHGENGFLVSTEKEWVVSLLRLIDSRDLRIRMGRAGRATVEREYSTATSVRRFVEALAAVSAPGQETP